MGDRGSSVQACGYSLRVAADPDPEADRYGASAFDSGDVVAALTALADRVHGIDTLVLFGSRARGDAHPLSDVDLLVDGPVTEDIASWTFLRGLLIEELGHPVELLSIGEAEEMPAVLADALRDGVAITDREGRWSALWRDRARVVAAARAEYATYPARRAAAIARLKDESQ